MCIPQECIYIFCRIEELTINLRISEQSLVPVLFQCRGVDIEKFHYGPVGVYRFEFRHRVQCLAKFQKII